MLQKLLVGIGVLAIVSAGSIDTANAEPTKPANPTVLYSEHGKVKQEAWWALSYNHPGVIVCAKKGDKAQAVYRISRVQKKWPKKGYYWGGRAKKHDRLCNA